MHDKITKQNSITWHTGHVAAKCRSNALGQNPLTIWLTGLSGSGKSTLAFALERHLLNRAHACIVLDGDNIRHGLCRDLGFSHADRTENIRRVAEVARLMNDAGLIAITAFISPYASDREEARSIIGSTRFIEVFLNTPLFECEKRDPKGLYRKARNGQIPFFTGIGDIYDPPQNPSLTLNTTQLSVEMSIEAVFTHIQNQINL